MVTNTGNLTLDPVTVDDPLVGPVTCPAGPLAPGATVACTAVTYTLTQADVDAGGVTNTATVTGNPPTGPDVTSDDTVTTAIPSAPLIQLDKVAGIPSGSAAGDTIGYSFLVTNTGNVTLDPIAHRRPDGGCGGLSGVGAGSG